MQSCALRCCYQEEKGNEEVQEWFCDYSNEIGKEKTCQEGFPEAIITSQKRIINLTLVQNGGLWKRQEKL